MEKRYSIFISSTYEDLKEERRAVESTIIRAGDFPVGMESFPAADDEQFEFIKSIIDKCDYYILIIAGRYGSLASDGLSFTEKEYDYAVSQQVPVLVMLNGQRKTLPADRVENTARGKHHLDNFIQKASTGRILSRPWHSLAELKLEVREAIDHAKATKPRVGWVRGDSIAEMEAIKEISKLRSELEAAKKIIGNSDMYDSDKMAGFDDEIQVDFKFSPLKGPRQVISKRTTIGEIWDGASVFCDSAVDQNTFINTVLKKILLEDESQVRNQMHNVDVDMMFEQKITKHFMIMGLIETNTRTPKGVHTKPLTYWKATEKGKKQIAIRGIIRK